MAAITALCPRVDYPGGVAGANITILFGFPMRPWEPESLGAGGFRVSSALVPESYRVNRMRPNHYTIRHFETEWPSVEAWLSWAQDNMGTPFAFWLDQDKPTTNYSCYLVEPALGQPIRPRRGVGQYLGAFETEVSVRSVTGALMHHEVWSPLAVPAASVEVLPSAVSLRVG